MLLPVGKFFRGFDNVFAEYRCGYGTYSSGNRSDRFAGGLRRSEINISAEIAFRIGIDPDIDNDLFGICIRGVNDAYLTGCDDQEILVAADCRHISGLCVADRDGGVFCKKKH